MNLVINSQFRPFTYDEMVKPLVQYKETYDKVEQDYSDLATQTEMWKDIVNQTNSPEAYAMYKGYSDQLNSIVEDFSKGMTLKNRSALLGMKRDYARNITPIARASEAMNAANELRVKAGPDAIFEVGEYNSLDQFLHGKTANNRYQSREALTKKTAAMTEAAMAEALKDPEFKKAMGDQFWMITQHTGGSYDELMEAMKLGMMDNPIAQNRFSQIRQEVAKNSGIQNYDAAGQQAIMEAINTGLYAGLDKPVRNFQNNADHVTPAQAHSMRMQEAQLALSAASSGMVFDGRGGWRYDPTKDPGVNRAVAKASNKTGSSGSTRANMLPNPVMVTLGKDDQGSDYDYTKDRDYGRTTQLKNEDIEDSQLVPYGELSPAEKKLVDVHIAGGSPDNYRFYRTKTDRSRWWTGDNDAIIIQPMKGVTMGTDSGSYVEQGLDPNQL